MSLIKTVGRKSVQIASTLQMQKAGGISRFNLPYAHPNPIDPPKQTTRKFKHKHLHLQFKNERKNKIIKFELPNYKEKDPENMDPSELRTRMKEMGVQPNRQWNEKPFCLTTLGEVIDPYIPPEGDGKVAIVSKAGAKQRAALVTQKGKSMLTVRKIRKYEEDFHQDDFSQEAQKIYIDLHNNLVEFDEDKLHELTTENAYPNVVSEIENKMLRWTFLGSLEPPRVVHARHTSLITEDNMFAQITVRFHSKQTLAIYDRFGRLMYGSDVVARDLLEYIVFEKNISNTQGSWRIHGKIIPDWMPKKPNAFLTYFVDTDEETPQPEAPTASEPVPTTEAVATA